MKSVQVGVAAIAVAWAMAAGGQAQAAAANCSSACSRTFNQCTAGGGVQSTCMGAWMQCRNICNGVAVKPAVKAPAVSRGPSAPPPAKTSRP